MRLISASRRTDIPALYAEWFLGRIRAGEALYRNPYGGAEYRVSLKPEDVRAIIFWTKNPRPLLPYLGELDGRGYRYYFHFTLTGLPRGLETHVPAPRAALDTFRRLSERLGPERVIWRFDPIVLSNRTPAGERLERFGELARALAGYTRQCITSFVALYGKVRRNFAPLEARGRRFEDPPEEEKRSLVRSLAGLALPLGIRLGACCSDYLVGEGVERARCVDGEFVSRLFPDRAAPSRARPTREQCGCSESRDIGAYDTCPQGCAYCYATASRPLALARYRLAGRSGSPFLA
ncbi:MAG: DUF1848 domain-containing protein [Nitrospinota bacterium]